MKLDPRQEASGSHNTIEVFSARIYEELRHLAARRLAQEKEAHTLQPTALVHEVWLKIAADGQNYADQNHFFRVAAGAMRHILIDHARRRQRAKRGSGVELETMDEASMTTTVPAEELLAVHEALESLEKSDPEAASVVEMRYFVGLTLPEIAQIMGKSPRTIDRHWSFARAWLRREVRSALNL